jgi:hypothetical protein
VLGVALPIDPGEHQLEVTAPGYEAFRQSFQVAEGTMGIIEIPALQASAQTAPPVAPSPEAPHEKPTSSSLSPFAWAGFGVGAAGIVGGVAFGIYARAKDRDAKAYCPTAAGCFDTRGEQLSHAARRGALTANVLYGVGAAGLLTGLGFALFGSSEPDASAKNTAYRWLPQIDVGTSAQDGTHVKIDSLHVQFQGAF